MPKPPKVVPIQEEFASGPQDDQESIAAIHAGLDREMNCIDTAAACGLGHSETVVGIQKSRCNRSPRNESYAQPGKV
jgi:aryl-alcohol dehydrogenase-like predicted oxidoreductase